MEYYINLASENTNASLDFLVKEQSKFNILVDPEYTTNLHSFE